MCRSAAVSGPLFGSPKCLKIRRLMVVITESHGDSLGSEADTSGCPFRYSIK